jgi:hypothetical protein
VLLALALLGGVAFAFRQVLTGQVIGGRDAFRLGFPDSGFLLECLRRLELPLWNPYLHLGQPFAATIQSQAFYPPNILLTLLFGPVVGYTVNHLLHVALAAGGTWWLCRRLRCSPVASVFAAAAFGLSPVYVVMGNLRNMASAAAWTGVLLVAALQLGERPSARRVALLAAVTALTFLCGSPEVLVWQGLLAVLLVAATAEKRAVVLSAGAFAWAVGLCALVVLPAMELARNSLRGTAFQQNPLDWSTSWAQLLALAWPNAGEPRVPGFAGPDQSLLFTNFIGTLTCALALVGVRRSRRVLPFAAGALLCALLCLGRNFPPSAWLLSHPPFNFFRFPAKYLVGVCFCLAVLAAFGLDRLAVLARRVRATPLRAASALAVGVALTALVVPLSAHPPFREGASQGAPWMMLFLTGAGALFLAIPSGSRRPGRARGALACLAGLELCAAHLFLVTDTPGWSSPARLEQASVVRGLLPPSFAGRISIARGAYGGNELGDLSEVSRDGLLANRFVEEGVHALEGYGPPEPARLRTFHLAGDRSIYDLTGVSAYLRYGPPPFPDLQRVPTGERLPSLYLSSTALPRAFVVQRAQVVTDTEALARVKDPTQPFRHTAFLASGEPLDGTPCESQVRITEERANTLSLEAQVCAEGYLVLSDAHYPGWIVEVDGAPAPLHRADYALRAVRLPAGAHRVVFRYRPGSFTVGALVSLLSLLGLGVALARRVKAAPVRAPEDAAREDDAQAA